MGQTGLVGPIKSVTTVDDGAWERRWLPPALQHDAGLRLSRSVTVAKRHLMPLARHVNALEGEHPRLS